MNENHKRENKCHFIPGVIICQKHADTIQRSENESTEREAHQSQKNAIQFHLGGATGYWWGWWRDEEMPVRAVIWVPRNREVKKTGSFIGLVTVAQAEAVRASLHGKSRSRDLLRKLGFCYQHIIFVCDRWLIPGNTRQIWETDLLEFVPEFPNWCFTRDRH